MKKEQSRIDQLIDFTGTALENAEESVEDMFPDRPEQAVEGFHMTLVDAMTYRLAINGNWNREQLKEWMSDRVDESFDQALSQSEADLEPDKTIDELEKEVLDELGITEKDLEKQVWQREEDSCGRLTLDKPRTTDSIH